MIEAERARQVDSRFFTFWSRFVFPSDITPPKNSITRPSAGRGSDSIGDMFKIIIGDINVKDGAYNFQQTRMDHVQNRQLRTERRVKGHLEKQARKKN
mmetsp:Transcript_10135/g.15195  ORF Transcript_10135/g.15195 Transcript_10135/m.15195 type:complete len:98 (-) Transcript_10135:169-462(-)